MTDAPARRSWLKASISIILLAVVLYFVGKEIARYLREIRQKQIEVEVNFVLLGLSLLCLLGARTMNAVNTQLLLAALGEAIPNRKVLPIIWVSSLGRYIPGKMAVVAGTVVLLVRAGGRLHAVVASLFLSTAVMILIGLVFSVPLFFMPHMREKLPAAPIFAAATLAMALLCLYPPIFLSLCNIVLRRLKHTELPPRVMRSPFWRAIGVGLIRAGCVGLALWLCGRAIAPLDPETVLHAVASAALASVIGFFAVFAPAGLGVHEAIYLVTLEPLMGARVAVLLLVFRGLQVVADLMMAAVGGWMMKGDAAEVAASDDEPLSLTQRQ